MADGGDYLAGAFFQMIEKCPIVSYDVKPPGGKLGGLNDLDVVAIHPRRRVAFLAECTTHIHGARFGKGPADAIKKLTNKFEVQRAYAAEHLGGFEVHFTFWSPILGSKPLLEWLEWAHAEWGIEVIVNETYKARLDALRDRAKAERQVTNNPSFRLLQILAAVDAR